MADFTWTMTDDGSPSLVHAGTGEGMHNSAGALGETLHVYLPALRLAADQGLPLRVLSVGLGLGYCEIMALAFGLANGLPVEIDSFESQPMLRERFLDWAAKGPPTDVAADQFTQRYDQILKLMALALKVDPDRPMRKISSALEQDQLRLHGALVTSTPINPAPTVIFFDAFSRQTSPDLWQDELVDHLSVSAAPGCTFATYAATGALRRRLATHGFEVERRTGFAGKRHSTLAIRENPRKT